MIPAYGRDFHLTAYSRKGAEMSNGTKVRWGVLSTANIGREKVIPGISGSKTGHVAAIASRGIERAEEAAKALGIPKAYGSYEELLADPEIDAIYNPLPNHLHVPMTWQPARSTAW